MDASDESDDSDNDTRNDTSEGDDHWGCEKCGMKLSTQNELAQHKETHKKFQCSRCRLRFTSNYLANKHELHCQESTGSDVFEASRANDPLLVVMNSLGQLVETFSEARAINKDLTGIMKNQLKKAKHNYSASCTAEDNHQVQKTWTFLNPPTFTPSNVINHYSQKDITELKGKEFSGEFSSEENYTRLHDLTAAIGRIVKSKLITKDVATDLFIRHLKAPASHLASHHQEKFQRDHGDDSAPDFEDILILMEARYIDIKPLHALEQLNAMSKGGSESITDFFDRAWRCSHFASFTEEERDRYNFRNDTVKAAVMRNLGVAKRRMVDDEELKRKMKGKDPMEAADVVDLVYHRQNQAKTENTERQRPDFSTMGELWPANIQRIEDHSDKWPGEEQFTEAEEPEGRRPDFSTMGELWPANIQRIEDHSDEWHGEEQITEAEEPEEEKGVHYKGDGDNNWTAEAIREIGDGCFKCGKRGHKARQCFRYEELTAALCSLCSKGFHGEQECTTKRQENWSEEFIQNHEEESSTREDNWDEPHAEGQWSQQRANLSSLDSHGPERSRRRGHPKRGSTRSQGVRKGPGYSPWGQPARGRKKGGYYQFRNSDMGSEVQDQAEMDMEAEHHWC